MPRALMIASAAVIGFVGCAHLVLTFFGARLHPVDSTLRPHMADASVGISRRMTMWNSWIGFNASHSCSLMLFGALYGHLAIARPALLFGSPFLIAVGLAYLLTYLVLALRYWFSGPVACVGTALALYSAAVLLHA